MAKRSKRAQSLRALFAQIPDDAEILNILFDLAQQADRTTALVGAAILEDRLRRTIERYLRPDASSEFHDVLFSESSNGPLSSFDAKIRVAYCLGIVDGPARSDLDHIRRIRNGFAHSIPHHSFRIDTIRDTVFSLNVMKRTGMFSGDETLIAFLGGVKGNMLGAKGNFVLAIALYHWDLTTHYPNSG